MILSSDEKVKVTTRFQKKLVCTASAIPSPRTDSGNTSLIRSHAMGPKPILRHSDSD